ncbi:MAG: type II toxin-antitoxin system VapC family toxin [bacterium]|nr:type II toxin-antitoxin system VapC family toxin [bacterium]
MVILDTHIWMWWVHEPDKLSQGQRDGIKKNENGILGISAISCWEIAKLIEYKRLELPLPLDQWFKQALHYPGIRLYPLTPDIAIESTNLPGEFHRDPADQIITATARVHGCPLITSDNKILKYPHVETIK